MGKRSNTETVVAILQALIEQRSCSQAELGRIAGVDSQVARKHLEELESHGFPLERFEDPPQVYWSVPPGWFPGAVLFDSESVPVLLRQLGRLPRSAERDQLIRKILQASQRPAPTPPKEPTVLTSQLTKNEETYLPLVEDAATRRVNLAIRYLTTGRDKPDWRTVSIQSVVIGPPTRFLAFCHKTEALKWFRLDNVRSAHIDTTEPFWETAPEEVNAMLKQSIDGFHKGGPVQCSFMVCEPECSWVEHNLPVAMTAEKVPGGMRFTTTTAGVLRLARFVVGLGGAARAETPELSQYVEDLARGALEAIVQTAKSP
ncbi:MAG: WYL domain-containing protein [Polyangiaceae bacterium]|nr:WYL domain-containing protein [Polyangiaceae bacterium]